MELIQKSNLGSSLAVILIFTAWPVWAADTNQIRTLVKHYIETFALSDPRAEKKMTFLITKHMAQSLMRDHLTWYDFQKYAVENGLALSIQPAASQVPDDAASVISDLPVFSDSPDSIHSLRSAGRSVDKNESLLEDLFADAKSSGKIFRSKDELKTTVADGLRFIQAIQSGRASQRTDLTLNNGRAPSSTYVFSAILWYLQAKSGRKFLLHPATWQVERGFVGGGTYRLSDPGHRLYTVLTQLDPHVYRRLSSHYSMETEASSLVLFKHWGFDRDEREMIPLPGKKGTRSVLFGKLKGEQIFMKTETHGVNLWKPREVIEHLRNYFQFRSTAAQVGSGLEPHAHRENTDKKLTTLFNTFITETFKETDRQKFELYKKRGRRGIYEMKHILEDDVLLSANPTALSIIAMLQNYMGNLCEGESAEPAIEPETASPADSSPRSPHSLSLPLIQIKGCESIVTIDQTNPFE